MQVPFSRDGLPYWRLSGFYACYFAFIGCFSPYWGLYLKDHGFDGVAIGQLMSIYMATRIVGPNVWGWLADNTGKRLRIIRIGAFLGTLSVITVWLANSWLTMALAMTAFTFFLNAVLPQFEVITLQYLDLQRPYYSRIRIWGSLGFVLAVVGLGVLFEKFPVSLLPLFLMAALAGSWGCACSISEPQGAVNNQQQPSFLQRFLVPQVILFYVVFLLSQVAMGPYYTFYSLYMQAHGYSSMAIGGFWALGVLAEVVLFFYMYRFLRLGVLRLLKLALLISIARWLLTAWAPESLPLAMISQLCHAATFGVLHVCGINLVQQYFSGGNEGQGQALFSAVAYGAGGSLGALVSGYVWVELGMSQTFIFAAIVTGLALLLAWWGLKEQTAANA